MTKQRLDILLTQKGLCDTRAIAQKLIRNGKVRVKGEIVEKTSVLIPEDTPLEVGEKPPFVSRGGEKLEKALNTFALDVKDRICLDGGISTGGFTDCLLQKGAKKVYGIDVGYGQLAEELRNDPRLILLEKTNFRHLTPEKLYQGDNPANLAVMDLSFISLTKVLGNLWELLTKPKDAILLIKPQFEVGKEKVGKNGIVKNKKLHLEAIYQVLNTAINLGWQYQQLIPSPIKGGTGNIEYLLWLREKSETNFYPSKSIIEKVVLENPFS